MNGDGAGPAASCACACAREGESTTLESSERVVMPGVSRGEEGREGEGERKVSVEARGRRVSLRRGARGESTCTSVEEEGREAAGRTITA